MPIQSDREEGASSQIARMGRWVLLVGGTTALARLIIGIFAKLKAMLPAPKPGASPQVPGLDGVVLQGASKVTGKMMFWLLVLPALLSAALNNLQAYFPTWAMQLIESMKTFIHGQAYRRTIEFKTRYNSYGYEITDSSADHRNNFLQKAITLKVASEAKEYRFQTAQVTLSAHAANKKARDYYDDEDDETNGSVASQLKKLRVRDTIGLCSSAHSCNFFMCMLGVYWGWDSNESMIVSNTQLWAQSRVHSLGLVLLR